MKFEKDKVVSLGENQYQILNPLASGAVSDVYLAVPLALPESQVVIKLVRDDADLDAKKVAGMRREAEVLIVLNQAEDPLWPAPLAHSPTHALAEGGAAGLRARLERARVTVRQRRVIALLDSGEIVDGSSTQPFVVQEKAPPVFERPIIEGLADERRVLAIAQVIADTMKLVHRQGFSLKDFEPQTKWDRIRIAWLDAPGEGSFELKLIDWNITGGREEIPQDLFFFGGHLYHFLLGRQLSLDNGQPPARLGLGIAQWEQITLGSRQLLERLLHRDPRRRYQDASELEADLTWWLEALRHAGSAQAHRRLQDRIWQARAKNRHDRILALSDLALQLEGSATARQEFEMWAAQAKQELEKAIWLPIAHAWATLLTGAYEKAYDEFRQELSTLPDDSPTARMARIFAQLARAGSALKRASGESDIRGMPEWEALSRAVTALREQKWSEGKRVLQEAIRLRPEAHSWAPVTELLDLAQAGLKFEEAAELMSRSEPRRADAERDDWTAVEAEQVALLAQTVSLLREVQDLAPQEPEFQEQLEAAKGRHRQRQGLLEQYQDVQQFMARAEEMLAGQPPLRVDQDHQATAESYQKASESFEAALGILKSILKQDANQYRAQLLERRLEPRHQEAKTRWQVTEALMQAKVSLGQGEYWQALSTTGEVMRLRLPTGNEALSEILQWAQAGHRVVQQAEGYLETAQQYLRLRNFAETQKGIQRVVECRNQPFSSLPGGENLSQLVRVRPFRLPERLNERVQSLQAQLRLAREVRTRVLAALPQGNYGAVLNELGQLQRELPLTEEESRWLSQARSQTQNFAQGQQLIDSATAFEQLAQAYDLLSGNLSQQASKLREQIADKWLQLAEREADWALLRRGLNSGVERLAESSQGRRLDEMLRLAELALAVSEELEVVGGAQWPSWLEQDDERRQRLVSCEDTLKRLAGAGSWRLLSQQEQEWTQKLDDYLADYLRYRLEVLSQLSRRGEVEAAREQSQQLWRTVPDTFGNRLPRAIREGWTPFLQALQERHDVDRVCADLVNRLARGQESFAKAVREMEQLSFPKHPDVPVDDLLFLRQVLQRLAQMESELQRTVRLGDYARQIHQRNLQAEEGKRILPTLLSDLSEPLRPRVAELAELLTSSAAQLASVLCREFDEVAKALPKQLNPEPEALLSLYWQVRWWQERTSQAEKEAQVVLEPARATVRALLERAERLFTTMSRPDELDELEQVLKSLQVLNIGLVRLPVKAASEEGGKSQPLVNLPPGLTFEQQAPPLNQRAIESWLSIIREDFQSLSSTPAELAGVAQLAIQLQQALQEIVSLWQSLKLPSWGEESLPAQLRQQAQQYEKLVAELQNAHRLRQDGQPKEARDYLNSRIANAGLIEQAGITLWLLEPQRRLLRRNEKELGQLIREDLNPEVSKLINEAQKALKEGDYSRAHELAQKAGQLLPPSENQELQRILLIAPTGARLLRLAQEQLFEAQQNLDGRKLTQVNKDISSVLGWDNKQFASLPGKENLSELVRFDSFHLPKSFKERARLLLNQLDLLRQVRQNVQRARSRQDYQSVERELGRLIAKKVPLNAEETEWSNEARAENEKLNRVRLLIESADGFEALRQAHSLLSDDLSAQASAFREQIGEKWAQLVKKEPDLAKAASALEDGILLLGDIRSSKRLEEMLTLVEEALQVRSALDRAIHRKSGTWLEQDQQRRPQLEALDHLLKRLTSPQSWPLLRTKGADWNQKLLAMLVAYLRQQLLEVADLSKVYEFEQALRQSQQLRRTVPDAFLKRLPADLGQAWSRLTQALEERRTVEQEYCKQLKGLAGRQQSFSIAVGQLRTLALPNHADVPIDDLERLSQELEQISKIESELQERPTSDSYALHIYQRRSLAKEGITLDSRFVAACLGESQAERLGRQVDDLQESLTQSVGQIVAQLSYQLRQGVEDLSKQPESDPEAVISLYWQACWCKESKANNSSDASEAVSALSDTLPVIFQKAEKLFRTMSRHRELHDVSKILETLQKLNLGLARPPIKPDGQPLIQLPPWPIGKTRQEQAPQLNQQAIESWISVVAYLLPLSTEEALTLKSQDYVPSQIHAVSKQAIQVQEQLQSLREKGWPLLKLSPWSKESTPAQLEQEVQRHKKLAVALNQAHRKIDNRQVKEASKYIEQRIDQPKLVEQLDRFTLWLLTPQRELLRDHRKVLRERLMTTDLAGQIADILKDRERAVGRLRQFLRQVRQKEVAERVRKAVWQAIDDVTQKKQRQERLRLITIVIEATERWGESDEEQSWWQKLINGLISRFRRNSNDRSPTRKSTTASVKATKDKPRER